MPQKKYSVTLKTDQKTMLLIQGVVLLVVGILLCCSVSLDNIVNVILGVALLLGGLINLVICFIEHKSIIRAEGVFASALIAVGVLCFIRNIIQVTPLITMFIIVVGVVALLDGLLGLLPAVNRKRVPTLVEAIVGAALFALGMCLWFIADFARFASLILGIAFIVLSVLIFIPVFVLSSGKRVK